MLFIFWCKHTHHYLAKSPQGKGTGYPMTVIVREMRVLSVGQKAQLETVGWFQRTHSTFHSTAGELKKHRTVIAAVVN